jgi:hypothetical protein
MNLLYDSTTGRIYYTVKESERFFHVSNTTLSLSTFTIDEVDPENKLVCQDLLKTNYQEDVAGLHKYYMVNNAGTWELHERDGWVQHIEDYG